MIEALPAPAPPPDSPVTARRRRKRWIRVALVGALAALILSGWHVDRRRRAMVMLLACNLVVTTEPDFVRRAGEIEWLPAALVLTLYHCTADVVAFRTPDAPWSFGPEGADDPDKRGVALRAAAAFDWPRAAEGDFLYSFSGDPLGALLERCPNLRALRFDPARADSRIVPAIANMRRLESLTLETQTEANSSLRAETAAIIKAAGTIREFKAFGRAPVDVAAAAALARLSGLQEVWIVDPLFGDAELDALSGAGGLTSLMIGGTRIGPAAAGALPRFIRLQRLDLSRTAIGDQAVAALAGAPAAASLENLDLSETNISDAAAASLRQLPRLWYLSANRTRVGDLFLLGLGGLQRLDSLELAGTETTPAHAGKTELFPALRRLTLPRAAKSGDFMPPPVPQIEFR
jgi:hypothetical protein